MNEVILLFQSQITYNCEKLLKPEVTDATEGELALSAKALAVISGDGVPLRLSASPVTSWSLTEKEVQKFSGS